MDSRRWQGVRRMNSAQAGSPLRLSYQRVHAIMRKAGFPKAGGPWSFRQQRGYHLWFGMGTSGHDPVHGISVRWNPSDEAPQVMPLVCAALRQAGLNARLTETAKSVYLRPFEFTLEAAKNFLHEFMNIYLYQDRGWCAKPFDAPYDAPPTVTADTWQEVFERVSGEPVALTT